MSSRRKRETWSSSKTRLSKSTWKSLRNSIKSMALTESGLSSLRMGKTKTLDPKKPKRTIFWSKLKRRKMKSHKFKRSGSLTRLSWLSSRQLSRRSREHAMTWGLKKLFLSKRNWDWTTACSLTRRKLGCCRLLSRTSTLRWTSLMTSTIKILLSKPKWPMTTSTLRTSSSKSWRS